MALTPLSESSYPLKRLAMIATIVLAVVGGALTGLAEVVDWPWIAGALIVLSGALHWVTALKGQTVVTPQPHVDDLLDGLLARIEQPTVDPTPAPSTTPNPSERVTVGPADGLDAAAKAAGLD